MNRLIKNEFKKLFSKKIIYILFIISLLVVILTNVIFSIVIENLEEKTLLEQELKLLEKEMDSDENKLPENKENLIDIKTQYEKIKLALSYGTDSWQFYFIDRENTTDSVIRAVKTAEENNDQTALEEATKEYNSLKQKLENGDWQSFVKDQLDNIKDQISSMEELLKDIKDTKTKQAVDLELENLNISRQAFEWRLEKNITYGSSFLSKKIEEYMTSSQYINSMKDNENKSSEEQANYNEAIKSANIAKYYIENNINIKKEYNAGKTFANTISEYGLFIVLFSIIIAGTIVSNESQKGTIKLLLTRPYSRNKILLSKYIVCLITILMFIIGFLISQFIVGCIVDGFDVFKVPIVEFNVETNSIAVLSVFKYAILKILFTLPVAILLSTFAFLLSTVSLNSALSVAMPILGYMGSNIVNVFIDRAKFLKYFVTANWDLSVYMFGGKGVAEGLNFAISFIICLIYLVIMLISTFSVFNKRDIKNV